MFVIYKLRAEDTIDYAAGELKKYLRMMMPECGEIDIRFDPHAKDGSHNNKRNMKSNISYESKFGIKWD